MEPEVAVDEQATLHDTLRASFDEHIPTETPDEPAPVPAAAPGGEAKPATATPAADDRPRGPDGKFVEKKAEPTAATATASTQKTPTGSAATPAPAVGTGTGTPAVPALARPSSWKKELEPQWAALPPDVQKYVLQREGEFAKGVSTYKTEWDNARPLIEAMRPFQPLLQQHGIKPDTWISNLGNAHVALAQGSPEQKLSMFLKLAQDYQVPVHNLFQQGADGKVYFNPQVQAYQAPAQQTRAQQQPDVRQTVQQVLVEERARQSLAEFEAVAAEKYPHFELVKEDMALLLDAKKADTYEGAYKMALRLHDDLWQAEQESQSKAAEAERQRQATEAAQRARRNTVSPRTATPAITAKTNGKKDLRGELLDAWDQHTEAGRV